MNHSPSRQSSTGPAGREAGEASGNKTGLRQPSDDGRVEDKLENVDLDSRGAKVNDHLRNKRSKGVAGEYDDSVDHDADEKYVQDKAAERPAK
ncbi:hypothetical protein [Marilutibacter aestuarii]|uniref:Uncharacterized protein n=1 Tax=Marilutibacter aestuarii TaxID=1706195 RepID=A0A508AHY6_9GAMM|nr:hypothetical protein [Lysobacter aestuarii]TQD45292.1 hypothetical protein FKV25_08445 [Lysobacter aestuarii]